MNNIIETESLSKSYGEVKAVDNISFSVEKGSLFAFLGVNGAGKSTTINILCSILQKDSGKVILDGKDIDKDSGGIKNITGIVFQDSVLDKRLSVYENLKTRASFYGIHGRACGQRIEELSGLLSFGEFLNRPYGKLSGGQRRRIDIARGLINKPQILFLDEPTTGLDPKTRVTVWEIIDGLRNGTGLTVFLTTHYMEEAGNADKIVIIDSGKIAATGTPNGLKNKYTYDYIKIYSEKNVKTEETLKAQKADFSYRNNSYVVKTNSGKDVKEFIAKNGVLLNDFEVIKGDMDDVFLNVTGRSLTGAGDFYD